MTPPRPAPRPGTPAPPVTSRPAGDPARAGTPGSSPSPDRSGAWLGTAAAGLTVLAGASATVSFSAQYRMVEAARHLPAVAALEAAIPDAAALIFASLGIALALHGRRAIRSRLLNLASVGTSVAMNVLAAAPGWRDLAIWAMPPVAYALASDTLITVIRATVLARRSGTGADEATPLAMAGQALLWLARLCLAPAATLRTLRARLLTEPAAPAIQPARAEPALAAPAEGQPPPAPGNRTRQRPARAGTKTARFLALVTDRHGPLAAIPLADVSKICTDLASEADLDTGAARTALRKAVLAAQNGSAR